MLNEIDSFLLRRAQKTADCFSGLTGMTKFKLEKWSFIMASFFLASFFTLYPTSNGYDFPYVLISLLFIWTVIGVWGMEKREEIFLTSGTLVFTPESQPMIRKTYLVVNSTVTIFTIIGWITMEEFTLLHLTTSLTLSLVALYFSACIPKPPCKGKIREWYERMLWRINDALAPVGEKV